ncbi:hypothetical protein BX666DRAFT_1941228 [Dichotomocladium elegans]|nr:hypothetical protein BX666DRAFT_1941228 [Dichotomocladium elegans]
MVLNRWHKKDAMDKSQPTGSTALHVACANGCIRIVDLLLRNSASIFLKDKYGSTPLDVANAKGSHVDIVRRLLEMTAGPRPTYSRVDKPLPIPIQAKLQNSSRHPQHQQQPSSNLPDLSSSHPSHKSSISSSDSCWYGVGTTGRYEEGDQYIKALERRLNASLDDAYPWSHHRLDTDTTSSRHTSSNCDQNYDCNYYDKQSLLSHPTPYALQMSLDSLNKASRNSLDVLSKKPDYDMVPLPTVPATPAIATAATSHRIGSLKPKALKKFLLWSWRKTGSFAVG